jgi:hypothetical protein
MIINKLFKFWLMKKKLNGFFLHFLKYNILTIYIHHRINYNMVILKKHFVEVNFFYCVHKINK